MSRRIYLHIGAMKTGTSFIQGILTANADALRSAGVLVAPNRSPAVHDVIDFKGASPQARGAWPQLVRKARRFDGTATVLSHEYLSLQGPPRVDKVLASLEGFDVQVVLTVRDATAVLPAQWQTAARNNGKFTWVQYVEAARDEQTRLASHTFLRAQRIGKIIRIWRNRLGPEAIHVVTVPPPSAPRALLWDRFASVVGVDPSLASDREVRSNPSAGYATAHLLCLVHEEAVRRRLPHREVQRLAVFVADRAAARRDQEPSPPLDAATLQFTADWNREVIRVVKRARVEVTGDLADLPVRPDLASARPLLPPDDESLLPAALAARGTLAQLVPPADAAAVATWSSADGAAQGLVDLMAAAIDSGGIDLLNARGTALRSEEQTPSSGE